MQIYNTGAPDGAQVVAQLVNPNTGATAGEVLATVTAVANNQGTWQFQGAWPPAGPGGNAELLSQTEAQGVFGVSNTYWTITEPVIGSTVPKIWSVNVTGNHGVVAQVSSLAAATALPFTTPSSAPSSGAYVAQLFATGPGGTSGAALATGTAQSVSAVSYGAYDCAPSVSAITINWTGFLSGVPQSRLIFLRPTTAGTLTVQVGGTSVGTVGYSSGQFVEISIDTDDGGATVVVGSSNGIAPASMSPAVPWIPMGYIVASATPGQYEAVFTAFIVERTITLTRVVLGLNTSSGNVDVGIYDSTGTNSKPGNRLIHSGSTATPSTVTNITNSVSLGGSLTVPPGLYWAAAQFDNATAALLQMDTRGIGAILGNTLQALRCDYNVGSFGLPATAAANNRTDGANTYQVFPAA